MIEINVDFDRIAETLVTNIFGVAAVMADTVEAVLERVEDAVEDFNDLAAQY